MKTFKKYLQGFETALGITFFALIVLFSLSSLIIRNFVETAGAIQFAGWVGETIPHLILLLGFIGASIGISRNEVIRIEILQRLYSAKIRSYIQPILYFISAGILVIYAYYLLLSAEYGEKVWIFYFYFPVFSLLIINFLLYIKGVDSVDHHESDINGTD